MGHSGKVHCGFMIPNGFCHHSYMLLTSISQGDIAAVSTSQHWSWVKDYEQWLFPRTQLLHQRTCLFQRSPFSYAVIKALFGLNRLGFHLMAIKGESCVSSARDLKNWSLSRGCIQFLLLTCQILKNIVKNTLRQTQPSPSSLFLIS